MATLRLETELRRGHFRINIKLRLRRGHFRINIKLRRGHFKTSTVSSRSTNVNCSATVGHPRRGTLGQGYRVEGGLDTRPGTLFYTVFGQSEVRP